MILAVYLRSNHPGGYGGFPSIPSGIPDNAKELHDPWYVERPSIGAHGYVTLIVLCKDVDEMDMVTDRLRTWFPWQGRDDIWYSGTFDHVFAADVEFNQPVGTNQWFSLGDNRARAVLLARDVLDYYQKVL